MASMQRKASGAPPTANDTSAPADSNYKGALPSQKYFTNSELNNLSRVGK